MNTTRTTKTAKRLTLNRETLRTLTKDELRLVNGGAFAWRCTYQDSGCGGAV